MKRQRQQRITLTEDERKALQDIVKRHTAKQSVVKRAKIILLADNGKQHQEIARKLGIRNNTVSTWVARWRELSDKPPEDRLQDAPRPGAPDKFTPEQLCQITAIACENPEDHGCPITHWTHRELARVLVEEGIVEDISPNHIGELLKKQICNRIGASIG
jgi:putative transposase